MNSVFFDLSRFLHAQGSMYANVLDELMAGDARFQALSKSPGSDRYWTPPQVEGSAVRVLRVDAKRMRTRSSA